LYFGFRSADENRSTERDNVLLGSIDFIAWVPTPHIGCSARSARHARSPEWPYRSWLASYLPSLALDAGGNPRIAAARNISGGQSVRQCSYTFSAAQSGKQWFAYCLGFGEATEVNFLLYYLIEKVNKHGNGIR
jgi:hypothetical protein